MAYNGMYTVWYKIGMIVSAWSFMVSVNKPILLKLLIKSFSPISGCWCVAAVALIVGSPWDRLETTLGAGTSSRFLNRSCISSLETSKVNTSSSASPPSCCNPSPIDTSGNAGGELLITWRTRPLVLILAFLDLTEFRRKFLWRGRDAWVGGFPGLKLVDQSKKGQAN